MLTTIVRSQIGPEDAARLKALGKDIQEAEKELAKLNTLSASLQRQASDLQKKMDEAGGPQLRAKRATVAKLQKVGVNLLITTDCDCKVPILEPIGVLQGIK